MNPQRAAVWVRLHAIFQVSDQASHGTNSFVAITNGRGMVVRHERSIKIRFNPSRKGSSDTCPREVWAGSPILCGTGPELLCGSVGRCQTG